ncbi:MAG: nitrate/nitrite transporter NrtS [Myxococcota bacterium]
MADWIRLATERTVVVRALKYAVVVGAILIAINHGDAILAGDSLGATRLWKMALTAFVPYMVSTLSSVGALRQFDNNKGDGPL